MGITKITKKIEELSCKILKLQMENNSLEKEIAAIKTREEAFTSPPKQTREIAGRRRRASKYRNTEE